VAIRELIDLLIFFESVGTFILTLFGHSRINKRDAPERNFLNCTHHSDGGPQRLDSVINCKSEQKDLTVRRKRNRYATIFKAKMPASGHKAH